MLENSVIEKQEPFLPLTPDQSAIVEGFTNSSELHSNIAVEYPIRPQELQIKSWLLQALVSRAFRLRLSCRNDRLLTCAVLSGEALGGG